MRGRMRRAGAGRAICAWPSLESLDSAVAAGRLEDPMSPTVVKTVGSPSPSNQHGDSVIAAQGREACTWSN